MIPADGIGREVLPVAQRVMSAAPGAPPFEFVPLPAGFELCLLYTSPSPRDQRGSRMPSSA